MKNFTFDAEIDGKHHGELKSNVIMIHNGKYTGGGMMTDPFAIMNDGLFDIILLTDPKAQGLTGIASTLDKAHKKGGIHIYDKTCTFLRQKSMKLTFKGVAGKKVKDNNWGV